MELTSSGDADAKLFDSGLVALANDHATILQQLSEGVIIAGPDGRLLFVNQAAERLHGVKILDIAPDDYSDTYHLFTMEGEPYPFADLPLARAVRDGETVVDARWRIRRPDGSEVIAIGSARPLVADGRQIGAILNVRDDTERFGAEQRLRQSEERNRLILDAATDYAIFTIDSERIVTSWSKGAAAIFGYSAEQAIGMCSDPLWTAEDRERDRPAREVEAARADDCANDVRWHQRRDGSRVFLNGSVHPLPLDDHGRERGFIKIARDETERRAAEVAIRESEDQVRLVLDTAAGAFYSVDREGNTTLVNRTFLELIGFSHESEVLGRKLHGVIHHSHADGSHYPVEQCPIYRCALTAAPAHVAEELFFRLDGTVVPVEYWVAPIMHGDKHVGATCTIINLSERKAAEEALRKRSEEFHTLADNIPALAWMAYADGNIFWYNRRWYEFTGTTPETQAGWGWESVHDPDILPTVVERWTACLQSGDPFEMTFPLKGLDGGYRLFLTRVVAIRDEQGAIVRWFGTNVDVTAQVKAEERQRFALLLSDRLAQLSDPREIVAAAVEVLGRHLGVTRVGFGEMMDDDRTIAFETDYVDGVAHLIGSFPVANFGRENMAELARGLTTFYPDVTADPRTNDVDWSTIETRAAMAVPYIRDGRLSTLLYLNHREVRAWLPEEVGLVQDVAARTRDALERARAEARLNKLNATLEARVEQEVARRAEAEDALRQAQKMETIGQLTGGIAHDFNNLLQIITGNLDILRRTIPEESPRLKRSVENAIKGADRAAVLTQRLLAFSRRQPLEPKVVDPNKLVSGMSDMLHRTLGETCAIETVTGAGLWRVEADPNQLEGALLNLAVNARDAMPGGGKLTIETTNTHLDRGYSDQHSGVAAGQYVLICVSDTGTGMDPDTIERAIEPFYTTKAVGKGTGLGLSMVYGFVKQSGGHLKIYSEPDQGTTVKIYLPRHRGPEEPEAAESEDYLVERAANETILLCEDDADVRAFSAESLVELGYRVIEAGDGESALELLKANDEKVDLLFTDVVLPGMTGAVLAKHARDLRPELKVLFTTGYARNAIVHHGRLDAGVELLSKPFTYAELAARIRDLLDAPPSA